MKLIKRTLYHYSRPFNGNIREGAFIRLETKNGRVGWGEVAPLPGFSKETLEEAIQDWIKGHIFSSPSVQWGHASALFDLIEPLEVDAIPVRILEKEKIKQLQLDTFKSIFLSLRRLLSS